MMNKQRPSLWRLPKATKALRRGVVLLCCGVLLALLASGCIDYEEHATFQPDGSGLLEMKVGFDTSYLSAASGDPDLDAAGTLPAIPTKAPGAPIALSPAGSALPTAETSSGTPTDLTESQRAAFAAQIGADVDVQPLHENMDGAQIEGVQLTVPFESASAFEPLLELLAQGIDQQEPSQQPTKRLTARLDLLVTGDRYTLSGELPPLFGEDGDASDPIMRTFLGSARRLLVLTLPGQVIESDADLRDGQTYTWRLDPLSSQPRSVRIVWIANGASDGSVEPTPPAPVRRRPLSPLTALLFATPTPSTRR